ncbi:hypothetical protein [Candidatus Poriferisodalis sp.]|uniref:hypothetical protein n=1 Tax=Candidatus Poriferisodalis sp. TaxID=3101277 RepID=UPI003B011F6A
MEAARASAPAAHQFDVHLIDGTYELFRHFFAVPRRAAADGAEVGALRGVLGNIVMLLEQGATHVAVATDHVVESFRNDLWDGYKDGSAIEPDLWAQFHPTEAALELMGVTVWPMVEFEADDAMAAGAALAAGDDRVRKVFICTPDKDLGQCVRKGGNLGQWSSNGIAVRATSSTRRASKPSSASAPSPSPTTWAWWATAQTASRACAVGVPSRHR